MTFAFIAPEMQLEVYRGFPRDDEAGLDALREDARGAAEAA